MARARSQGDLRQELGLARDRISILESVNKKLRAKCSDLRKATASTTRVVMASTQPMNGRKLGKDNTQTRLPRIQQQSPQGPNELFDHESSLVTNHPEEEILRLRKLMQRMQSRFQDELRGLQVDVERLTKEKQQLENQRHSSNTNGGRGLVPYDVAKLKLELKETRETNSSLQQANSDLLQDKELLEQKLLELNEEMTKVQSEYQRSKQIMQTKWTNREGSFRKMWDDRERNYQDMIEWLKRSATVTITRTVDINGEHGTAPQLQEKTSGCVSDYPELMESISQKLGSWQVNKADRKSVV